MAHTKDGYIVLSELVIAYHEALVVFHKIASSEITAADLFRYTPKELAIQAVLKAGNDIVNFCKSHANDQVQ